MCSGCRCHRQRVEGLGRAVQAMCLPHAQSGVCDSVAGASSCDTRIAQKAEARLQVLAQEMVRYNRLIAVIHTSLTNIALALKGLLLMSAELEKACASIALGRVPALWAAASYPSLKPLGSYLEDLYARLAMLQAWCAPPGHLLPR
jgi:Dynein heavy chain C-terminal domain